jgi:DNA-binding MarR family transcriptional regulator
MNFTPDNRPEKPLLIFLTNRIGRLLDNAIRDSMREEDAQVLPQHMGVLSDLWARDGLRQQDLAISLIKDKATIARSLQTLEEQSIVVRVADPDDKRNKRIYVTSKGKSLK